MDFDAVAGTVGLHYRRMLAGTVAADIGVIAPLGFDSSFVQ